MRNDLTPGAFYWVLIVFDPDVTKDEDWSNQPMPARYRGENKWDYIGDLDSEWPVRWVGEKIEQPE